MASMIEPRKNDTTILGDIQAHIMKKAAGDTDRRQDVIHPSELCKDDVCPRQIVYRISGLEKDYPSEIAGMHLQTIFQEGHDIHEKWQTWLAEMGVLIGNWKCKVCNLYLKGYVSKELPTTGGGQSERVSACPKHIWQYLEVPIDGMKDYLIHGHEDGAVGTSLIEVKSIGLGTLRMDEPSLVRQYTVKTTDGKSVVDYDSLWRNLKRPLVSHRKQAGLYLRILQENGDPYTEIIFIYENKANQQTKEFVVKSEPLLVDPMLDMAKDIKWAVEAGFELPIPVGFKAAEGPCKMCEWRDACRGGKTDGSSNSGVDVSSGDANQAEHRRTGDAGGSDPVVGQPVDDSLQRDRSLERVSRRTVGGSGDRREVRRVIRRTNEGPSGRRRT